MKKIHPLRHMKTSVSLPNDSVRRLVAARRIFARNGVRLSQDEINRRLFKFYLKNWRGRGRKNNRTRRYNAAGQSYRICPLYINQVLYAALWQRALHTGESISRILDVAIRLYLARLLEGLLGVRCRGANSQRNQLYWSARYGRRKRCYSDFFINYVCITDNNSHERLQYSQDVQILPKAGLSPLQIWDLMYRAT